MRLCDVSSSGTCRGRSRFSFKSQLLREFWIENSVRRAGINYEPGGCGVINPNLRQHQLSIALEWKSSGRLLRSVHRRSESQNGHRGGQCLPKLAEREAELVHAALRY